LNDTQTNTTTANSDEGVEGLSDSFNSVLLVLRLASHLHVMIESLLSLPLDVRVLSVLDEMPFDVVELVVHIASVGKMISDVVSSVLPVFKVLNLIEVLFHFPGVEEVLESLLDVPVRHELLNSVGVFSDEINETVPDVPVNRGEVVGPVLQLVQRRLVVFHDLANRVAIVPVALICELLV